MDQLKQRAAVAAVARVPANSVIGLGSGSTAQFAIEELARRIHMGELAGVRGVPTSQATARLAQSMGVPLTTLDEEPNLLMTIDGADEVDPHLNLIKGLGGALLREKIVAAAAAQLLVIVDESKLVSRLGSRSLLPVEVLPFGWRTHLPFLAQFGGSPRLRLNRDGEPYHTDNGNYILDCRFPAGINEPETLAVALSTRPGIIEHGLFLGMASTVLVGTSGGVQVLAPA